ncbi:hypothetical protein Ahy_A07g032959 [Arachis hypogaea]|uniref:Uncharacterized protein n=1 Tax=Arachis hypogaea TaxID=3818 RepID=A0A445C7Y6_ARAHY|nr:hypothetical protein Ahy_A07g032959 [Arachis hypogaea]
MKREAKRDLNVRPWNQPIPKEDIPAEQISLSSSEPSSEEPLTASISGPTSVGQTTSMSARTPPEIIEIFCDEDEDSEECSDHPDQPANQVDLEPQPMEEHIPEPIPEEDIPTDQHLPLPLPTCVNAFVSPPPSANEPLPLTTSQRCRTLPVFHTAPPNLSSQHLLADSTSQHHHRGASTTSATTHSIVFGFAKMRRLAYPGRGSDTEVTWEDEQNINKFGRLNNRFHELEDEIKITKIVVVAHQIRVMGFLAAAQAEVERLKVLRDELKEEKVRLKSDLKKARTQVKTSEAAATLAEGVKKRTEESYTRVYREKHELQKEFKNVREEYASLQESMTEGMDEIFENLKAQVQVLAPVVDLSLFIQDNIVVDGKIVPASEDEEEGHFPDPKSRTEQASQIPEGMNRLHITKLSKH